MNLSESLGKLCELGRRSSDWLVTSWLPLGWFALLSGMFWIGDRSNYHKVFYLAVATPTLLALVTNPRRLTSLLSHPLVIRFLLFAIYMVLSVQWSGTEYSSLDMAKRPLYIAMLLFAAILINQQQPIRLLQMTELSGIAAVFCALLSLGYYFYHGVADRFSGYGALYNPLLTAHVFGFFFAYWMARWYLHEKTLCWVPLTALISLWSLLVLTGSRTPLMAIGACFVWLGAAHWQRRLWLLVIPAIGLLIAAHTLLPMSNLFERGMSYRPAIWLEALRQTQANPWFGLGYTHPQIFRVTGIDFALADTHNIFLGILFSGGIVGLLLWLAIYVYAMRYAWQHRYHPPVLIASTLVVFGLAASLTEGTAFLSRPKEHWFLIWIPLALLAATRTNDSRDKKSIQET